MSGTSIKKLGPIVAIDGPAGSGKSTAARLLAKRLLYTHIDSGALYRGVALLALEKKVDLSNEAAVLSAVKNVKFSFKLLPEGNLLHIDGKNAGSLIRTEEVSTAASKVSAYPGVRALLLNLQRDLGLAGQVVLEGRDIGTVVFPSAEVKFFMTASLEVRAGRRKQELEKKGLPCEMATIQKDMAQRDIQDSTRAIAPLKQASDAILVDTSGLSIDSVLDRLESYVRDAEKNFPNSSGAHG